MQCGGYAAASRIRVGTACAMRRVWCATALQVRGGAVDQRNCDGRCHNGMMLNVLCSALYRVPSRLVSRVWPCPPSVHSPRSERESSHAPSLKPTLTHTYHSLYTNISVCLSAYLSICLSISAPVCPPESLYMQACTCTANDTPNL